MICFLDVWSGICGLLFAWIWYAWWVAYSVVCVACFAFEILVGVIVMFCVLVRLPDYSLVAGGVDVVSGCFLVFMFCGVCVLVCG